MKSVKVFTFLRVLAVGVPAIALVLAAADVGDGKHEAAIDQGQAAGGEASGDGDAIGAVAVEKQRRGAVERRALPVKQRNRHRLAVARAGA